MASVDEMRRYIGQDIASVPKPAAVLDLAKMRRHCNDLLHATQSLGVGFRAHIKTHKTIEGLRLQAGDSHSVKLVVSTIAELEHIVPVLEEFIAGGRSVNVLYGIPLPSQVPRLSAVARKLGKGTLSVLVDHVAQLAHVAQFRAEAGFAAGVYLKVDTGYHRAGLPPSRIDKDGLVGRLLDMDERGEADFIGLYSHSSLSYSDSTATDAMAHLESEIDGCLTALDIVRCVKNTLTISVGASPQVTSVENLLGQNTEATASLRAKLKLVRERGVLLELHAGVYSIMDMQQLSTRSRDLGPPEDEVAISVVAEVCSVYNDGERAQPEALAAVGVLGLGREPCPSYKGWGVVHRNGGKRMIVVRISQEHSILAWDEPSKEKLPLEVGQMVRIYPNHACITGAMYGWYFVVDGGSTIVDVWARARGW